MAVSDLVPVLAEWREEIVPLVGAGLCVDAGLPIGSALAETMRARSRRNLGAPRGDFGAVCRELERTVGLGDLQQLAAEAIEAVTPSPTASLMAIASCPSARVLTTNYDESIERSVERVGKEPVRIALAADLVDLPPRKDQVFVIHLHGVMERPETMVLTTAQRRSLLDSPDYQSRLRSLLLCGRLLVLGLRLSMEEPHIRAELGRLGSLMGHRPPIVVLPDGEIDAGLRILADDGAIDLYGSDTDHDYLEVRQCAQLLAPRQIDPTEILDRRATGVTMPFLDPSLWGPEQLAGYADDDLATSALVAESRFRWPAGVEAMSDARRALLIGAPGRGKTMALRRLGERHGGRAVRCDLRNFRPSPDAPERAFARLAAREGEAFDDMTPLPSGDALREGSFVFLLDGLEEAPVDDHAAIVRTVVAAGERWPQHSYVVATRPTAEAQGLLDAGFRKFVVEGTEAWGRRYLEACGITTEQIEHLYAIVPTIRSQLAIPRYAARIAAELQEETEGIQISRGALERLVRGERTNLVHAAQRLGVDIDRLLDWARRLAVMIESRGENNATLEEIARLPGPEGKDPGATCEELIQAALLQDLPDRARFSAQVSQEALCAEAILRSADPLAALRRFAMAEIGGEPTFRDDIEHTLDLVYEGADASLRKDLREIDELRWARTQTEMDPEAVAEAIRVIWHWHRERRLWIPYRGDNQLRGPGEALKALHQMAPEILESHRAELRLECRDEERTIRGNAIEMLTMLPADAETEPLLRDLIADTDDVVRRAAAHAIEAFGLTGLIDALRSAWEDEHDELALEAIGLAITTLCTDEDLLTSIPALRRNPEGWPRIAFKVVEHIDLSDLPALLASNSLGPEEAGKVLDSRLEDPAPFTSAEAKALGAILLSGDWRIHQSYDGPLERIIADFPREILEGAEATAGPATGVINLLWASTIDRDIRASFSAGPLGDPLEGLEERMAWQAGQIAATSGPTARPPDRRRKPENLAALLQEGAATEDRVPADYWLMRLAGEPGEVQDRFLALAEAWYPGDLDPAGGLDREPEAVTHGFRGAVVTWAALDHPVGESRWLEILRGRPHFSGSISTWMSDQWRDGLSGPSATYVRGLEDPADVVLAAESIPDWSTELRALLTSKVCALKDDRLSATVVDRLSDLGDAEHLHMIAEDGCHSSARQPAKEALAHLGDVPSQRQLLELMLDEAKDDPGPVDRRSPEWFGALDSPTLVDLLGELLRIAHSGDDPSSFRRGVEGAIRQIGDPSCLRLYDRLIVDPDLDGGQFYWYQREAVARQMARRSVLERMTEVWPPGRLLG